jgi:hypothetical protein
MANPHALRSKYTEQLVTRAERDPAFREQLKSDPRAAIGDELGGPVPEGLKLRVVEESADEVILVLPAQVEPGEISDEALAGAVGGAQSNFCSITCTSYHDVCND